MGMNGAGKSTLLKILTGVTRPTSGSIDINGRLAAILELGSGFHPELTGRENTEINGKLLGLTPEQIQDKIPEIIEFSELNNFFDLPVKTYSSGMYVRLAFSLATSVDPDILIIDEALSVGDIRFQQKCMKKIHEFRDKGVTILFVSHDLAAIKLLCDEVALLNQGRLVAKGDALDIIELYNAMLPKDNQININQVTNQNTTASTTSGNQKATITKVTCTPLDSSTIIVGKKVRLTVTVAFKETIENPTVGILIRDRLGYDVFGINTATLTNEKRTFKAKQIEEFHFDFNLNLGPGDYLVSSAIHSGTSHLDECYHWVDQSCVIQAVSDDKHHFLGVSYLKPTLSTTTI